LKRTTTYIIAGGIVTLTVVSLFVFRKKKTKINVDLSVFDSPDEQGSGVCMDKNLIGMLLKIEKETGYAVLENINSGARSQRHNAKVGGVKNSAHKIPICKGVDIGVPNTTVRDELVRAAKKVGFKRIGIGRTFVHLDNDDTKPQYAAWGYPNLPYHPFKTKKYA